VRLEYSDEPIKNTNVPKPPLLRRSEHERKQIEFYRQRCNITNVKEPKSVSEAQTNQEWLEAMENEIEYLHDNNVWDYQKIKKQWEANGYLKC